MATTGYPPNDSSGRHAALLIRRYVNDEIADLAGRFNEGEDALFDFLCECGDLSCERRVKMTLAKYRLSAPGSVVGHLSSTRVPVPPLARRIRATPSDSSGP